MATDKPLISLFSHQKEPRLIACNFRIKYRDIFHMKYLYKLVHLWIIDNDWGDAKQHENFYGQITDASKNHELWIWWEVNKKSETSYYKYWLKITWHVIALGNKEIMHEGKKVKANTGEVEIKMRGWIEFSEGGWRKNKFLSMFPTMFRNRIFHQHLEDHKRELYREVFQLQGIIKRYLNMKGFLPEADMEPFHVSYSWPN